MDKKYIEENEIEIKYLRNQLTPEEVEEFEVYLMENPNLLVDLETKDLMNSAFIVEEFAKPSRDNSILSRFFELFEPFTFALGVACALLVTNVLHTGDSDQSSSALNQVVYLAETRGVASSTSSVSALIEFPSSSFAGTSEDKLVLVLDVGFEKNSRYTVTIDSIDHSKLDSVYSSSHSLLTDASGTVTLVVPVRELSPRSFVIKTLSSDGVTKNFSMDLRELEG